MAAKKQLTAVKSLASKAESLEDSWDEALKRYRSGYGAAYFTEHRQNVLLKGYTILEGFADFSSVPDSVLSTIDPSGVFKKDQEHRNGRVQELFEFFMSTFPGEERLKNEENRKHWNPIVNSGDLSKDTRFQDRGIARYSSTRMLLMDEIEDDESKVWAAVSRASLDVWVAQLAALLQLRDPSSERLSIPRTGGRLLLTGKNCPRQKPHNDFEVRDCSGKKEPGYFIMVSGNDEFPLWVCDYSHHFVYGSLEERKHFAKSAKLRCITVPANSVVIAHGYLTHGGAGERDRVVEWTTMRYHMYLIPGSAVLPDAICFAFDSDTVFKLDK